jgi:hypothetical protein
MQEPSQLPIASPSNILLFLMKNPSMLSTNLIVLEMIIIINKKSDNDYQIHSLHANSEAPNTGDSAVSFRRGHAAKQPPAGEAYSRTCAAVVLVTEYRRTMDVPGC